MRKMEIFNSGASVFSNEKGKFEVRIKKNGKVEWEGVVDIIKLYDVDGIRELETNGVWIEIKKKSDVFFIEE